MNKKGVSSGTQRPLHSKVSSTRKLAAQPPDPTRLSTADPYAHAAFVELPLNLKLNHSELGKFIDVIYGALASYLLFLMGQLLPNIGLSDFENVTKPVVALVCLLLVMLFIIEDYKDMKLVTAVCGYYMSSFRFFLDVSIALLVFAAVSVFNKPYSEIGSARGKFCLFLAMAYGLCCIWAVVLKKDERVIPAWYRHVVFTADLLMAAIWSALYVLTVPASHVKPAWCQQVLFAMYTWFGLPTSQPALPFLSPAFLRVATGAFVVYYALGSLALSRARKHGVPVSDILEMFPAKLVRGIILFIVSIAASLWRFLTKREWKWAFDTYDHAKNRRQLEIEAVAADGTKERFSLQEYLDRYCGFRQTNAKVILATVPGENRGWRVCVEGWEACSGGVRLCEAKVSTDGRLPQCPHTDAPTDGPQYWLLDLTHQGQGHV